MSTITAKDGTEGYYTDWGESRDVTFSGRQGVHHRWTAEQLAEHAARLARKNEALEDFAALVAHDVKSQTSGSRDGLAVEIHAGLTW